MSKAKVMSREERLLQQMRLIAGFSKFTMADLRSTKKGRRLSRCRELIAYVLHDLRGFSYPEIGRAVGKDHTTILYAARRFRKRKGLEGKIVTEDIQPHPDQLWVTVQDKAK